MENKAVILGSNYYIGLSTIRCLGIKGIHTVAMDYSENDRYGSTSKYCNEKLIVPHFQKDSDNFISYLINYAAKQTHKPVLIPCHDSYVEVIDMHLNQLKEHYYIPQTEQGLYTEVMNKETLANLAIEKGMKVPETVRVDEQDFHSKVETIIKFPCLVKPVDSPTFVAKFRKKLFKVYTMEELEEAVTLANNANLEVIIQRIIPGFDDHMYTFDAYLNQDSKVTHWVTCQKLRQYPINFGASVYTIQKYVPELHELGANFLEAIKYKGFAEIEFKKDAETGDFYLIEINARITNLNTLLNRVGINFPYITYQEMIGEPMKPMSISTNTNIAFRYWYEDMLAIRDYVKAKQLSILSVLKSLFRSKAYAIWDWIDMKPGITYSKLQASKIVKRIFNRG